MVQWTMVYTCKESHKNENKRIYGWTFTWCTIFGRANAPNDHPALDFLRNHTLYLIKSNRKIREELVYFAR